MSELIRARQPWKKSTGPRTAEGKAKVSMNAWKGGRRPMVRMLLKRAKASVREAQELFREVAELRQVKLLRDAAR